MEPKNLKDVEINYDNLDEFKKRGLKLKKEKKFEDALDLYEDLTKFITSKESDESIKLYDVYYNIGDILLDQALKAKDFFDENFTLNDQSDLEKKALNNYNSIYKVEEENEKKNLNQNDSKNDKENNEEIEKKVDEENNDNIKDDNNDKNDDEEFDEEEEDVDDIQLAWENLETCKYILENEIKKEGIDKELKNRYYNDLVVCLIRLSNAENYKCLYKEALNYLEFALEITKNHIKIEKEKRLIEIYFLLGTTYNYELEKGWEDKTIEMNNKAIELLKKLLSNCCENLKIKYDEEMDVNNLPNNDKELKNLLMILQTTIKKNNDINLEKIQNKDIDIRQELKNQNSNPNTFQKNDSKKEVKHLGTFGKNKN